MKIKSQKDFWSGLMFVVVGVAFALGATGYPVGTSAQPGAGYFPLGLGVLLALLGMAVLFKALTLETEDGGRVRAWAWKPLGYIVVAVAVFGFLLPRLGLLGTLPLLVVLSSRAAEDFRWRDALLNALVLTLGCWALFIWGLKLTIPLWPVWPVW